MRADMVQIDAVRFGYLGMWTFSRVRHTCRATRPPP